MSGRPSGSMVEAMKLVLAGVTPYQAARRMGLDLSTMYRSRLYKLWKDGTPDNLTDLKKQLDLTAPKPRTPKKRTKFVANGVQGKS